MTEKPYKPSAELVESDLAASSSASNRSLSSYMLQAIDRIQELEAELAHEKDMYSEAVKNSQKLEMFLSGVAVGTHCIVPVEPTDRMICEGISTRHMQDVPEAWSLATINIYRAMIKAAKEN